MSQKPLIVANWKLHGSGEFNRKLITDLKTALADLHDADFVICPPFVYLADVGRDLRDSQLLLGAQNVSDQTSGAFTGEVSAAMLAEVGCEYVIMGHMERRSLYAETDDRIARKFKAVQGAKLMPILCVGETLKQRDAGEQYDVVASQLNAVSELSCGTKFVVAYEPGWAIGTGRVAEVGQIYEMHRFIYEHLAQFMADRISDVRVIYGGSVNKDNALTLFGTDMVDGALVGGASLDAESFGLICKAACDAHRSKKVE